MDLLDHLIALVHIIELKLILIEQHGSHRQRIVACVVEHLSEHHALHRQIERLLRGIAPDSCHLVEMAQLTSIIGHLNSKLIACSHFLGEIDAGTSTVGLHTLDEKTALAFITKFIRGCDGLLIAYTSTINGGVGDHDALCRSWQHRQGHQGCYNQSFHYLMISVCDLVRPRNSGA